MHGNRRNSSSAGACKRKASSAITSLGGTPFAACAHAVRAQVGTITLPTYLPAPPEKNPMFLERRVYQGSSGKVYPLPFTDRIAETPVDREWKAVWIENEFLRVLVLPEIGGRIHAIQDKTTGYDLIYNQHVIKPALVGLAGSWISGGIEFNWPQHHRPATFLPVDFEIERHPDGSVTVWCSDHDPLCRMKGMHGICLHPDRAYVELKVRAYNRTPMVQTFLWWANVATRAHEAYQSFFPPDVSYVADHARRSMSAYPFGQGFYYGVDYGERGRSGIPAGEIPAKFIPAHCLPSGKRDGLSYEPNDLSFYSNIPTPCSYMCMDSKEDFCGGYDHKVQAGIVHIADHHIAPGKKQWTWGNHEFGYAWDRNLTDKDANGEHGPYLEIMAGVYTDNQPDFSFLQPGEIKAWSQYWYSIQKIGPAQHANLDAALSFSFRKGKARVGVSVTRALPGARLDLVRKGKPIFSLECDLAPGKPVVEEIKISKGLAVTDLQVRLTDRTGKSILAYQPRPREQKPVPSPASEPPPPAEMASGDELFITGLHLEQYRHATRCPTLYWREALRRDPLDSRCNTGMGRWHFKRGEFQEAEQFLRKAIERLTWRNPNPYDGEAYYQLGLCLRHLGRDDEAYDALYKSTWNQAWAGAAYCALAEIDCTRHDWAKAREHCEQSEARAGRSGRVSNLHALVLRRLGDNAAADALLAANRAADPLDWWTRHLQGESLGCDLQTRLDLAQDYARAGFFVEALDVLHITAVAPRDLPDQSWGVKPLVHYTRGWLQAQRGNKKAALLEYRKAAACSTDYCFPSRLEEIAILNAAMRANAKDACAPYYLGNLLYHRERHEEAIALWEKSARLNPNFSIVWRNLGIGFFNVRRQPDAARVAYDKACKANPADARLLYERDQLWKRLGESPDRRLAELEKRLDLVHQRDDLSVELCALYNQTGFHEKALGLVVSRKFQPWEGGEGGPLGQWVRSHLMLGRKALADGDAESARKHFDAALTAPENLGEARHLLANQSDIHYWCGLALARLNQRKSAEEHWRAAATFKGDFQEMSVRAFSEMTYYSALAWRELGNPAEADNLLQGLETHAQNLRNAPARIDYFATSLPTMLLFHDDLQLRQETTALILQAQARLGLGDAETARHLLQTALNRDPNHPVARDLWGQISEIDPAETLVLSAAQAPILALPANGARPNGGNGSIKAKRGGLNEAAETGSGR